MDIQSISNSAKAAQVEERKIQRKEEPPTNNSQKEESQKPEEDLKRNSEIAVA